MTIKIVLAVLALALAAGLTLGAALDVSQAWDVWSYHLPFAARIVGMSDPSTYAFSADNEARFAGFPLVAEALQGVLWRVSGRPESANFVALLSLFGLVTYLFRVHAVPPAVGLLALVAIPLVQTHAAAGYIDLPANVCAALLLLTTYQALVRRDPVPLRLVLQAALFAALAANMKFQMLPAVVLGLGALFACAVLRRGPGAMGTKRTLLVFAAALPIVFATPIKNVVRYHNPVWPEEVHVLGVDFPHLEEAYASSPAYLEHASRPRRFAWSLFEVGLPPIASQRRWSIDQYTPPSEPGYRMGGYFGAYVGLHLAALIGAASRRRSREATMALLGVGAVTLVTCALPQSHELRYYLYWMLLLVSVNLALWAGSAPRLTGLIAAGACAIVLWGTSARYVHPSGDSFAALLARRVDRSIVERAADGERICVAREPWTFLYARTFHPHLARYTVQEATSEAACAR
ncbi:hypothetical protein [Pendulispora albinea]|uniref:Glycosyltransferase RgtA/B/C/D-like domain-containing protein n=1 Tax=Pendulispora albinea TaxID=2741071 RepID=A0ABZ2LS90_9BACT